MKYAGTVTILDDQGESILERELTADEMIDEILKNEALKFSNTVSITKKVLGGVQTKEKKKRLCSKCHLPGHIARNCTNGTAREILRDMSRAIKAPRTVTCTNCAEKGHTKKTCKKGSKGGPVDFSTFDPKKETRYTEPEHRLEEKGESKLPDALTPKEFSHIKMLQHQAVTAIDIAEETGHVLEEVILAMDAPHYMGYVHEHKK